jgi:hypothetical protein
MTDNYLENKLQSIPILKHIFSEIHKQFRSK